MSLHITYVKDRLTQTRAMVTWSVGSENPLPYDCRDEVIEVQATEDELMFIRTRFNNLPMVSSKHVRWFGDHARFIVGNLPTKNS